ncbi:hypothetical protein PDN13_24595 [Bacillus cereus]|nr:hypothetical protein [Bacillus cereus]
MITLQRTSLFKENTYQKIVLRADSEKKLIEIKQEYFKTQSINEIKMTYDEYIEMDKLVKECIDNSLRQQYKSNPNNIFWGMGPHLVDDEKRIVTVTDNKNQNLSVQITNKHVVNVVETFKHENQSFVLKINFDELKDIFRRLYYFFNILNKKSRLT